MSSIFFNCLYSLTLATLLFTTEIAGRPTPRQDRPEASGQGADNILKVEVQLVSIPITVRSKNSGSPSPVSKNDVDVFEDGKRQIPKYLSAEAERPLTLGILFDNSGPQQPLLAVEQEALGEFLEDLFRPQDMAFVISFSTTAELLRDVTSSIPAVREAFRRAEANRRGEQVSSRGSPPDSIGLPSRRVILYDAIYLAIVEKLASEAGRKVLIIFTDGQDQGSTYKLQEVVAAAQREDVTCVPLVIGNRYRRIHDYPFDMKTLARESGGRLFFFSYFDASRIQKPRKAFRELAASLRNQYSLGFVPSHSPDGRFHRIRIRSKTGAKIDAPTAYYAAPISVP